MSRDAQISALSAAIAERLRADVIHDLSEGGLVETANGPAAFIECLEERGLLSCDALDTAETFGMRGVDQRDDANLRARDLGEARDLAGLACAHLEDGERLFFKRKERHRQANPVI